MSAPVLQTRSRLPRLERHWRTRGAPPADFDGTSLATLQLPPALCRLLACRGLSAEADARAFLKPRIDQLLDPLGVRDMDVAVERVERAIEQGETILIHGDYDVDGICASALLTRTLRDLGATVVPFVPHRMRDGYDFGAGGLTVAREAGASLIVTADCGVVAHETVRAAVAAGMDVIVTDHHTPAATLPDALAVVNPARPDCDYEGEGLCGTGVAFKLCQALWRRAGRDPEALLYRLDLVALATIADLVPLTGENRVLARYGLRVLPRTRNAGLRALMRAAGLRPEALGAGQVSHVLAPRINAAGRIGDAASALRLLLCDDEIAATPLAEQLEAQNRERRQLDRETLEQAVAMLEERFDPVRDHALVLAREDWHPGVIGIVASRVVELTGRPTVLIALRPDGTGRGSGRSIRGFDLHAALSACAGHLERFGGHRAAAGLDIRRENVDAFARAFGERARSLLAAEDFHEDVAWDMELALSDATPELARLLRHLGPFGLGNPTPTFVATRLALARPPRVMGQGHLRLVLRQGDARLHAVGFGMAGKLEQTGLFEGPFDAAFQLRLDEWQGRRRAEAKLVDLRPST